MTTEHPDWGRRLSDALRAAIGRNDLAAALALALPGLSQMPGLAQVPAASGRPPRRERPIPFASLHTLNPP